MKASPYFVMLALLSACSQLPPQAAAPAPKEAPVQAAEAPPPNQPELPKQALTATMLYQSLLGDIAAQRGQTELAAQAWLEFGRQSRDPRVVRRAAQLAMDARSYPRALEALQLWQEVEPGIALAGQMQLSLLLSGGRYEEAAPVLRGLLQGDATQAGRVLLQLHGLLQRMPDKRKTLDWLLPLVQEFPTLAEGHWLVGQLAAELKEQTLARSAARRAVELKPEWGLAVVFEAQQWMADDAPRALALLREYLANHPGQREVRLFYARALLEHKEYAESREQFRQLLHADPDNTEMAFAVSLLSLQLGEYDRAEKELQQLLAKGNKDADTVHYYLAQLHEARKDAAAALAHYREVRAGDYVFAARLREAQLLNQAGRLDEALAVLHQTPVSQNGQRVALIVQEAQMLRDAGQHQNVYEMLQRALEQFPQQPQLLFEAALAADKLERYEEFEQLVRRLIEVAPDSAHAYNLLGYSLLERNIRIEEGMQLVEKALQLAPNDAAIIDSVGWGHYRRGDLARSLEFLRRAYALHPDPEIAAHLGEVLCLSGSGEEGRHLLHAVLREHPDNRLLQDALRKCAP